MYVLSIRVYFSLYLQDYLGSRLQICRSTSSKVVVVNDRLTKKIYCQRNMVGNVVDGHMYVHVCICGSSHLSDKLQCMNYMYKLSHMELHVLDL